MTYIYIVCNMNQKVKLDKEKDMATFIHSLSHDGRGIATIADKTTFISGALPNETVTYKIIRKHSHFNEATTLDVLTPSLERVAPPCEHFSLCGGCSLQYMNIAT